MGKRRGLRTARKLHSHRRDQKWHDKQYKKAHLGTALKANPFAGASHAKGIVLEKVGVEAKQPNSAIRKCVRVQLMKNGKKIKPVLPPPGRTSGAAAGGEPGAAHGPGPPARHLHSQSPEL
uniref:Small ribosomal subunit protein uS12 n=1 Tax=Catagonus wagneri TaxID=51154 RepID=A0A8C3X1V1_9CETA